MFARFGKKFVARPLRRWNTSNENIHHAKHPEFNCTKFHRTLGEFGRVDVFGLVWPAGVNGRRGSVCSSAIFVTTTGGGNIARLSSKLYTSRHTHTGSFLDGIWRARSLRITMRPKPNAHVSFDRHVSRNILHAILFMYGCTVASNDGSMHANVYDTPHFLGRPACQPASSYVCAQHIHECVHALIRKQMETYTPLCACGETLSRAYARRGQINFLQVWQAVGQKKVCRHFRLLWVVVCVSVCMSSSNICEVMICKKSRSAVDDDRNDVPHKWLPKLYDIRMQFK